MKKLILASLITGTIAGCSSVPDDPYERRSYYERERKTQEMQAVLDNTPDWMTTVPTANSAVYANGSAYSSDISMADEKATLIALGKICTAAGGTVNKSTRVFQADYGNGSAENSTMAIQGMCKSVDVTGAEVVELERMPQGTGVRTFVLMALPMGDANQLQMRKDQIRARELAAQQAQVEFSTMSEPATQQ